MRSVPKSFFILFVVLSFLGFLDASYLALEHYLGRVPACTILEGCEVVTTSPYATLEGTLSAVAGAEVPSFIPRGISVALLGSFYYLFIFIVSIAAMDGREWLLVKIAPWTAVGFAASLWFFYVQSLILGAFCVYCLASAATSTALFIVGMVLLYWNWKHRASVIN